MVYLHIYIYVTVLEGVGRTATLLTTKGGKGKDYSKNAVAFSSDSVIINSLYCVWFEKDNLSEGNDSIK